MNGVGTDGFNIREAAFNGLFQNINTLIGGTGSDTLFGVDRDATWRIGNTTTVTSDGRTTTYSAIEIILGGAGKDTFVSTTARPSPARSTGAAAPTRSTTAHTPFAVTVNPSTNTSYRHARRIRIENVTGGSGTDSLTGDNGANEISGNGGTTH